MNVGVEPRRLDEARTAMERVLNEYREVFGPDPEPDESPMLIAWNVTTGWDDMAGDGSWTVSQHSGCIHATRVGLIAIAHHEVLD